MTDLSTSEITMFCLSGLYMVKEFVVPAVKGAFAKNVKTSEERDQKVEKRLDKHGSKIIKLDRQMQELAIKSENASQMTNNKLSEIKGQIEGLDRRIAESGQFHDKKLTDALQTLSTDFNRRLTSTMIEMETKVREAVRAELDKKSS